MYKLVISRRKKKSKLKKQVQRKYNRQILKR